MKKYRMKIVMSLLGLLSFITYSSQQIYSLPQVPTGEIPPKWTEPLSTKPCLDAILGANCQLSSPVLANITGNAANEIIVATNSGHIMAFTGAGNLLWDRDIASYFGVGANSQEIASSPAVGDIDNNGSMEIVVGVGTIYGSVCTQGGVVALDANGNLKSGDWPFLTDDYLVPPAGCRDSVVSTPALGDLDNNGTLEIVFGSFDKRIYVVNHNGSLLPGFPVDSYLFSRFGWPNLEQRLADTTWSSPALGDIDNDGYLDIVIGTDEGNFDGTYGGNANGWICPYSTETPGYCGGTLYVLNRFGQMLPGFPTHILEHIQSSPALYDMDGNGRLEIFVGAGTYYYNASPDHPTYGFRLYAWDSYGQPLAGWQNGLIAGGNIASSPAIGDIAGDSNPEVIVLSMDKKLYVWNLNGTPVAGFPMTPVDFFGSSQSYNYNLNAILADYTTDDNGKMEIFFSEGWAITIIDGDGSQITGTSNPDTDPIYYLEGLMQNSPAVGDVDGDGELELVANNSNLYVWDMPAGSTTTDWPMFRRDAARNGNQVLPSLLGLPDSLFVMAEDNGPNSVQTSFTLSNESGIPFTWASTPPANVSLAPANGTLNSSTVVEVTVSVGSYGIGMHNLGSIALTGTANGRPVVGSPASIPVTLWMVDQLYQTHLPIIQQ